MGKRLSVLNVNHNYFVKGGSDSYFFDLEALLVKHGHNVVPFASSNDRNRPTQWSSFFPQSVDTDRPKLLDVGRYVFSTTARRSIRKVLSVSRIDVAHFHNYYGKLTASIFSPLKEMESIPIVQTLHDYKVICPVYSCLSHGNVCEKCEGSAFWHCAANACNRGSTARSLVSMIEAYVSRYLGAVDCVDHFIAPSFFLGELVSRHGIPVEKITPVHNFIDSGLYQPSQSLGQYFLYFGRLETVKGLDGLIKAAARLPSVPVKIVGDGNQRIELESLAQRLNAKNIEFLGYKRGAELHELVRGSVATLLPSIWYENCPMSVLESMAFARPVIGSRIGGIPELINHENDGLLVSPGDEEEWGAAMIYLWGRRDVALEMGRNARYRVDREFNADIHYSKLMEVYRKVGVKF